MTLTDAGPLVALIDADEADHELCATALAHLELPLVTTWPAFTEAMYLLARGGGAVGQAALWRLVTTDRLLLIDLSQRAVERSAALMSTYGDLPMDLADATLVAVAEERGLRRVFTLDGDFHVYRLDGDFHVYRLHGRDAVDVIPGWRRSTS